MARPFFAYYVREPPFKLIFDPTCGALSETRFLGLQAGGSLDDRIILQAEKSAEARHLWDCGHAYYPKSVKFDVWGPEGHTKKSSGGFLKICRHTGDRIFQTLVRKRGVSHKVESH